MLMFKLMSLVALAVITECQVSFPSNNPKPSSSIRSYEVCTASNGQRGLCYEHRSSKFKECSSFFPSTDTGNPEVADHLKRNTCKNDGTEIFFCCPSSNSMLEGVIPSEEECGQSLSDNVVFGEATKEGQWPWLVSIGFIADDGYQHHCGGTLITKQHVISAAHCFTPLAKAKFLPPNKRFFVRLGEYNTIEDNDEAQDFDIMTERMHNYNEVTKENDIILLKLDKPLSKFSDTIRPACLPYHLRDENFEEKTLTVVGWGIFDNRVSKFSPIPIQANVPVVPLNQCQRRYQELNGDRKIDNRQFCAGTGGPKGGPDSCGGDSGGPINYLDVTKSRFYVVGAVSFGPTKCGHDNIPGVYARIGHYLDWIEENIRELL